MLLKQHVGHGVAVEGKGQSFAEMRIGGGGLGLIEAQSEKRVGRRNSRRGDCPGGLCGRGREDFDDIGFAHLEIEELAKGGLTEGDFDGVEERAAGPGFFVGAKLKARGLDGEGIAFVGSSGLISATSKGPVPRSVSSGSVRKIK